jgi:hypothetical protein
LSEINGMIVIQEGNEASIVEEIDEEFFFFHIHDATAVTHFSFNNAHKF